MKKKERNLYKFTIDSYYVYIIANSKKSAIKKLTDKEGDDVLEDLKEIECLVNDDNEFKDHIGECSLIL